MMTGTAKAKNISFTCQEGLLTAARQNFTRLVSSDPTHTNLGTSEKSCMNTINAQSPAQALADTPTTQLAHTDLLLPQTFPFTRKQLQNWTLFAPFPGKLKLQGNNFQLHPLLWIWHPPHRYGQRQGARLKSQASFRFVTELLMLNVFPVWSCNCSSIEATQALIFPRITVNLLPCSLDEVSKL